MKGIPKRLEEMSLMRFFAMLFVFYLISISCIQFYYINEQRKMEKEFLDSIVIPPDYQLNITYPNGISKQSEKYPDNITNEYVFSHTNIKIDYMGQYQLGDYAFCGIQNNTFKRMINSSWYQNQGTSYYGDGFSYHFPPELYTIIYDYDNNRIGVEG